MWTEFSWCGAGFRSVSELHRSIDIGQNFKARYRRREAQNVFWDRKSCDSVKSFLDSIATQSSVLQPKVCCTHFVRSESCQKTVKVRIRFPFSQKWATLQNIWCSILRMTTKKHRRRTTETLQQKQSLGKPLPGPYLSTVLQSWDRWVEINSSTQNE